MDIFDCPDCDRLRANYRQVTRDELELNIKLDQAALKNENGHTDELRSLLTAISAAREGACRSILEHQVQHVSRTS